MATAKPSGYDPVKSIEGMYHGTLTRIAYAFKDAVNFGPSTKDIIQECSKRYQDALDDCEIQILEAKWYLEHQLVVRKQKREARAREEQAATAKRKHSEIEDTAEKEQENKRLKVEDTSPEAEQKTSSGADPTVASAAPAQPKVESPAVVKDEPAQQKKVTPEKPAAAPPNKPTDQNDDFFTSAKQTPDPGTVATMEEANDFDQFESMFGEPAGGDGGGGDGDLEFDLGLNDDVFGESVNDTNNEQNGNDASDLNALLPGLDSYANQDSTANGTGEVTQNQQNNTTTQALDFGLPDLEGPNEFDMMFDSENFGDAMPMDGDPNLNDDDANLDLNMDLESMFN